MDSIQVTKYFSFQTGDFQKMFRLTMLALSYDPRPPGNKHYLQGHFKVNSPSMGRFKELGRGWGGDRMHPFGAGWMPQFIRIGQGHCWE